MSIEVHVCPPSSERNGPLTVDIAYTRSGSASEVAKAITSPAEARGKASQSSVITGAGSGTGQSARTGSVEVWEGPESPVSLVPVSVHARDNNQTAIIGILDGRDA